MRLSRDRLAQACVYPGASIRREVDPDAGMRLFRGRLPVAQACVYPGIGRPEHASIPEPVDPGMRLFRGRLAQACVYPGRPVTREHAVYPGVGWPKHASIPGSVGLSMRLSRRNTVPGRLVPEPVPNPGCRLFHAGVGWPKHGVYPGIGSAGAGSMRLSRSRLTRACVSIPGSAGPSMRQSRDRSA